MNELDYIQEEDGSNPCQCLIAIIKSYLKSRPHTASWSEIVKALKSPYVGYEHLAHKLASKFLGDVMAGNTGAAVATPGIISTV